MTFMIESQGMFSWDSVLVLLTIRTSFIRHI